MEDWDVLNILRNSKYTYRNKCPWYAANRMLSHKTSLHGKLSCHMNGSKSFDSNVYDAQLNASLHSYG